MKVSYDRTTEDRKPKAYIEKGTGDLIFDNGYYISSDDGDIQGDGEYPFDPNDDEKVFYEGDSVTLTF